MKHSMLFGFVFIVSIVLSALVLWMGASAHPAAPATSSTYVVNSTNDNPDADVGDGVCADASSQCTLRAAIMQANFTTEPDTITLPAGEYLLTRPGYDDGAVLGDLDIANSLTIQGAGAGTTIIDGNGAVTGDRVIQILSSATAVSLSGLTIRNGEKVNTFDEGGGLYWEGSGSHLLLDNVIIEGNTAYYGGGIYLNYSTSGDIVDLEHVVLHANTATAAAGGLGANFGDFAGFSLVNSQVYSNTAYEGGGVYIQGTGTFNIQSARIDTTVFYSNTASLSAGIENHSGNAAVPVTLVGSHLYHNHAGFYGGAIGNYGALDIISSTLYANTANVRGGGLYDYEGGVVNIAQSTLSGNFAQFGGGIFSELFIHNNAQVTLSNSTLSSNIASRNGGGLYANGGHTQFYNTTIAGNRVVVPIGTFYSGIGGGIYIAGTATVTAENTLIGYNSTRFHVNPPVADDCFTSMNPLDSLGYNLIETTTNCVIGGNTIGNIIGLNPQLGPLQNNGGPTQTQSPLTGSPAIDHGNACLPVDQRGYARPIGPQCDIGSVEFFPLPRVFLPTVIK